MSAPPDSPRTGETFREGVVWNFASLIVLAISGIALNLLIGVLYDAAALGVFNQVLAVYIFFSMFAVGGINLSALKLIAESPDDAKRERGIVRSAVALTLLCSVIVTLVFWMLRSLVSVVLESPGVAVGMAWIAPGLFFFGLNKTLLAVVNGRGRMKAYAIFQGLRYFNLLTGLLVAILLKFPGARLTFVFSLSECILCLVLVIHLRALWFGPITGSWRTWIPTHLRFGGKGILSEALIELNSRVDVLMLGYFLSDSLTGIYSFAAFFFEGFLQFVVVLRNNYNPHLSRFVHEDAGKDLYDMIRAGRRKTYLWALAVVPLSIVLYPVGLKIVQAAGTELDASWLPYAILACGLLLAAGYLPFHGLLVMGGRPGWHTIFMIITVMINFIFNTWLIPRFGISGAALGTALSLVISNVTLWIMARVCLGVRMP
jgi:O-antigen/teichoic acid export membrane protein